jgi:hypothetical protein
MAQHAVDLQKLNALPEGTAHTIEFNAKGEVAVTALATTFVSFPSGLFILFRTKHDALMYIYVLLVFAICVLFCTWSLIDGQSPYQLAARRFRSFSRRPGKRFSRFGPINALRWVVYGMNGLLIMLSASLYATNLEPLRAPLIISVRPEIDRETWQVNSINFGNISARYGGNGEGGISEVGSVTKRGQAGGPKDLKVPTPKAAKPAPRSLR